LSAALRTRGSKYSVFMGIMWQKNIILNRKVLSNISIAFPEVFTKIYEEVLK
jgi:ribosomal protein L20